MSSVELFLSVTSASVALMLINFPSITSPTVFELQAANEGGPDTIVFDAAALRIFQLRLRLVN